MILFSNRKVEVTVWKWQLLFGCEVGFDRYDDNGRLFRNVYFHFGPFTVVIGSW